MHWFVYVLQCKEDDLKQIFSEFGVVHEAKIALKPGKTNCTALHNVETPGKH